MMKKFTILECLVMVFACSAAFALTVAAPKNKNITVANVSVSYPLSSETSESTSAYTISAGQNNTGTVYVGDYTVSSTNYGVYLNAGDTYSANRADTYYKIGGVYLRGTVVNDTVSVIYNNA